MGYSEILTYSLVGQIDYDKIGLAADSPSRDSVRILNPLGEDTSLMRTTTLPSMLGVLAKNKLHRNLSVRLYELATIYCDIGETLPDERPVITLGAYGDCDFFTIKGVCETLLAEMRVVDVRFEAETDNPSYHPGRTAAIYSGETKLGTVGQVYPLVAKNYGLDDTFIAEIDFLKMLGCMEQNEIKYTQLPRFPSIARDVAVVCDEAVTIAELMSCIKRSGGKLLREVKLFDIYAGDQVSSGKKSVAFSLTLRADDKTLTDEEANGIMEKIINKLEVELSAIIRK
jgi:phenylalanyl-tRNA synthetase beta chain